MKWQQNLGKREETGAEIQGVLDAKECIYESVYEDFMTPISHLPVNSKLPSREICKLIALQTCNEQKSYKRQNEHSFTKPVFCIKLVRRST